MTDNTEAMELWREAVRAYGGESIPGETENYAAAIIAAKLAELRALIPEAECMKQMRETAQDMGYADCLDALEALSELRARIEGLTQERDGARKAMDLFMSAPGMPPHVLQWVQFRMSRHAMEADHGA
jgi:hypothetical protein